MCGIFGYVGVPSRGNYDKLHRFVHHLAHESEVRGTHSTGFAARFDSGHVVADKLPYRGSTFCSFSSKFRALRKRMPTTFIGHTRYGTGSSPKIANNNHPFFGKKFHMVHNGVIPSWNDIARRNKVLDLMNSETDSEIVLRILEKRIEDEPGTPFKKHVEWILDNVWGNMAIALLDLSGPHVWLFRNENPINLFLVPEDYFGQPVIFFASTREIFNKAWKSCFKTSADKNIADHMFLKDNQLFRLSNEVKIVRDKPKRFLHYPITVKSPFRRSTSYYGYRGASSNSSNNYWAPSAKGKTSNEDFWSDVVDPTSPELGCRFEESELSRLREKLIIGDSGIKAARIDGLTIEQYQTLNRLYLVAKENMPKHETGATAEDSNEELSMVEIPNA